MNKSVAKVETSLPDNVVGAASLMEVISRAASDPTVDVNKLERLMAMAERMQNQGAERAFNEAMKAAQEEMPRILRDASNSSTNSKYARLETVAKKVTPIITKNGFSISFGTDTSPLAGHYRITAIVSHVGGHSRPYFADVPSDMTGMKGTQNKTATHGFGSTMSYGRRYLTLLIFNITLVNEDDDGNASDGNEPINAEQLAELSDMLTRCDGDPQKFCKYMKVEALAAIMVRDMGKAREALNGAISEYQRNKQKVAT